MTVVPADRQSEHSHYTDTREQHKAFRFRNIHTYMNNTRPSGSGTYVHTYMNNTRPSGSGTYIHT